MLRILTQPVQSVAPSFVRVLKYSPTQARAPKGTSAGGQFAKMPGAKEAAKAPPDPTHARSGDVAQIKQAFAKHSGLTDEYKQAVVSESQLKYSRQIRGAMKERIKQELTERLKDHPAFADLEPRPPMNLEPISEWVKAKIDLWADTAGDSSSEAGQMQLAVQREFGLSDAPMDHIQEAIKLAHGGPVTLKGQEEVRLRAFVRAEYDRTQEWLKANGITHVSVFRGQGDEDEKLGFGYEDVTMQPASSWTTDIDTAIEFAGENFEPKVLTTRVPASQVLSTCVTGRGCLAEEEVILLGKPQRARVFDASGREVDPESSVSVAVQLENYGKKRVLASLE